MNKLTRSILAAIAIFSIQPDANANMSDAWRRCIDQYGDGFSTDCSQMSAIVRDSEALQNYWFNCMDTLVSFPGCNEATEMGTVSTLLEYSWVQVMGNSNIRYGPGLDHDVSVITAESPTIMSATRIVHQLSDREYRWVEVNFVIGLDEYFGYVREDRIITSFLEAKD